MNNRNAISSAIFYRAYRLVAKQWVKMRIKSDSDLRTMIYRDLASHLRTSTLSHTLVALQRESEKLNGVEQLFYEELQYGMEHNSPIFDQLDDWLPRSESLMIKAGRKSKVVTKDSLAEAFDSARAISEKLSKLKDIYIGSIRYPALLIGLAFGMFIIFRSYGMDFIQSIVPYEKWPVSAKERYGALSFFFDNIFLFSALFVAVVSGFIAFMLYGTGTIRNAINRIPPFSIYQAVSSYTFLLTLSSMVNSGVHIGDALKYIESSLVGWAKNEVKIMTKKFGQAKTLYQGESLTEYALNSQMFPLRIRVKVGSYARRDDFIKNLEYLNEKLMFDVSKMAQRSAFILSFFFISFFMFFVIQIVLVYMDALVSSAELLK